MNKETVEWAMIISIIVLAITIMLFIATLPFAFIGWITLSVINIFTAVSITFFNSAVTGFLIAIVAYRGVK